MPLSIAACSTVLPFSTVTCRPSIVSVTVSISDDHNQTVLGVLGVLKVLKVLKVLGVLKVLEVLGVLRVRGARRAQRARVVAALASATCFRSPDDPIDRSPDSRYLSTMASVPSSRL